jgi:hypothetical protein
MKSGESSLANFLTANAALVAWMVFLGFGGAILALYYYHIGYFPELEWKESFSYLIAMSILGGGIVAIYGLLLYFPGLIWSEFLIFDSELVTSLCYRNSGENNEPCFWSIVTQLLIPFAALMVLAHLAIFANDPYLVWTSTIVGLAGLTLYSYQEFFRELRKKKFETKATLRSLLVKYVLSADIAAIASVMSLLILRRIVDPESRSVKMFIICTAGVVVSNLLVAVQFRNRPTRALLTGIVAAITLLICGEFFAGTGVTQSERIMKSFGLGDRSRKVALFVTGEVRPDQFKDMKEASVGNENDGKIDLSVENGTTIKNKVEKIDQLVILSRLGAEYLVENEDRQRFVIPKKAVRYWSSIKASSGDADMRASASAEGKESKEEELKKQQMKVAYFLGWLFTILMAGGVVFIFLQIVRGRRRMPEFWKGFSKGRTRVVVGTNQDVVPMAVEDAMALSEIQSFFTELHFAKPELIYASQLSAEDWKENLIVLGGPESNRVSKHLSAGVGATFRCEACNDLGLIVLDLEEGRIRLPEPYGEATDVFHDHVLIYRMTNPYNREAQILVVAGRPGHGTCAGVRYLLSDEFLDDESSTQTSFELLLRSEIHFGVPRHVSRVVIRSLVWPQTVAKQRGAAA